MTYPDADNVSDDMAILPIVGLHGSLNVTPVHINSVPSATVCSATITPVCHTSQSNSTHKPSTPVSSMFTVEEEVPQDSTKCSPLAEIVNIPKIDYREKTS